MRSFSFAVVCGASALAVMQCASAADMPGKALPAPAVAIPVWNWTGWYLGANVGYGWGDNTDPQLNLVNPGDAGSIGTFLNFGVPPGTSGGNLFPNLKPAGAFGGGQIEYDHQFGSWVLGGVADIQAANLVDSQTVTTPFATTGANADETLKGRIDWFGTVRGKVGYAFNDWLVYASGGLAYGHIASEMALACTPGGLQCSGVNFLGSNSETKTGWAAGAGVAYHVAGTRATIGLEYLHIDLGRSSVTAFDQTGNFPTTTLTQSQRFANELIRFTLNFKL